MVARNREGRRGWGRQLRVLGFFFGVTKMFWPTVVTDSQPCEYTERHWKVHFKMVN